MWLLLAETGSMASWIQLASAGGMGALAWFLIAKIMPEKDREHRLAMDAQEQRHRAERQADHERWLDERSELRSYLASRDARWMEYAEKRDDQIEKQSKEWIDVLIRMEALILGNKRDNTDA